MAEIETASAINKIHCKTAGMFFYLFVKFSTWLGRKNEDLYDLRVDLYELWVKYQKFFVILQPILIYTRITHAHDTPHT